MTYAIKIPLPAITFFLMNTESSEKLPLTQLTMKIVWMITTSLLRYGKEGDIHREKLSCTNTSTCGNKLGAVKIHINGKTIKETLIIRSSLQKLKSWEFTLCRFVECIPGLLHLA